MASVPATMKEAKYRWSYTRNVLVKELRGIKPTWEQEADGTPVATVLWARFIFLKDERGHVYAQDARYRRKEVM